MQLFQRVYLAPRKSYLGNKGVPIASSLPTKASQTSEGKQPFRRASLGSSNPAWPKTLLQLLFKTRYTEEQAPKTCTTNLLAGPPIDPKEEQRNCWVVAIKATQVLALPKHNLSVVRHFCSAIQVKTRWDSTRIWQQADMRIVLLMC